MGEAHIWLMPDELSASPASLPCDTQIIVTDTGLVNNFRAGGFNVFAVLDIHELTTQSDVNALVEARISGVVTRGLTHGRQLQMLDVMLSVAEATHGVIQGSHRIFAVPGDNPAGLLNIATMTGKTNRLCALGWDRHALAFACNHPAPPADRLTMFEHSARTAILLAAAACRVPAVDTATANNDESLFAAFCEDAKNEGFGGKILTSARQADIARQIFRA